MSKEKKTKVNYVGSVKYPKNITKTKEKLGFLKKGIRDCLGKLSKLETNSVEYAYKAGCYLIECMQLVTKKGRGKNAKAGKNTEKKLYLDYQKGRTL